MFYFFVDFCCFVFVLLFFFLFLIYLFLIYLFRLFTRRPAIPLSDCCVLDKRETKCEKRNFTLFVYKIAQLNAEYIFSNMYA